VYLILTKVYYGGCDRSAEDAYSWMAPDPTFAFVGDLRCSTLDSVYFWGVVGVGYDNFAIQYSEFFPIILSRAYPALDNL
jgi:hypothetical protein